MIPSFEHPSMSTLSTPTPARTIAFIFLAAAMNFSSTSVELRVIAISASPSIPNSSVLSTSAANT